MEFFVEAFGSGTEQALLEMEAVSADLAAAMREAIIRIQFKSNHGGSLTEYIEPGLLCVRVRRNRNIARLFFAYGKNHRIWLLNGFVKKTEKIPTKHLVRARQLLREVQAC